MTTSTTADQPRERILSPAYAATTVAMFCLIAFVAFEAMAVATVMPTVARDLDGLDLYALAFAAPLASGVVGMVAAGMWSDRTGPVVPLLASMALFSLGLLVCGLAPSMEVLLVGRVLQGLGGGALTVGLYVVVGLVFPAALRPAIFASFAAAWVLPALFGPGLAALVADGGLALGLPRRGGARRPRRRAADPGAARPPVHAEGTDTPVSRLVGGPRRAAAVLVLELLGSARGVARWAPWRRSRASGLASAACCPPARTRAAGCRPWWPPAASSLRRSSAPRPTSSTSCRSTGASPPAGPASR